MSPRNLKSRKDVCIHLKVVVTVAFPPNKPSLFSSVMRFLTIAMYSLKANVLNMLIKGQRTELLDTIYIHSLTVHEASLSTSPQEEDASNCNWGNLTDIPLL